MGPVAGGLPAENRRRKSSNGAPGSSSGGLAPEQLSAIHGKLIALGMLKFEIGSRADGVQYQLTTLGRQALVPPAERELTPEWMLEAESPAA